MNLIFFNCKNKTFLPEYVNIKINLVIILLLLCSFNKNYGEVHAFSQEDLWNNVILIDRFLLEKKVNSEPISDLCFLRKTHLDLLGRTPSIQEINDFNSTSEFNRRANIVDRLILSPEFNIRMKSFYSNFFKIMHSSKGSIEERFLDYLETQTSINKPYDLLIQEILNSKGSVIENPAVGIYFLNDHNLYEALESILDCLLGLKIDANHTINHQLNIESPNLYKYLMKFFNHHHFESILSKNEFSNLKKIINKMVEDNKVSKMEIHKFIIPNKKISYSIKKQHNFLKRPSYNFKKNYTQHIFRNLKYNHHKKFENIYSFSNWLIYQSEDKFSLKFCEDLFYFIMGNHFRLNDNFKNHFNCSPNQLFKQLSFIFKNVNYDIKKLIQVFVNSDLYQLKYQDLTNNLTYLKKFDKDQYINTLKSIRANQFKIIDFNNLNYKNNLKKIEMSYILELNDIFKNFSKKSSSSIESLVLRHLNNLKNLKIRYGLQNQIQTNNGGTPYNSINLEDLHHSSITLEDSRENKYEVIKENIARLNLLNSNQYFDNHVLLSSFNSNDFQKNVSQLYKAAFCRIPKQSELTLTRYYLVEKKLNPKEVLHALISSPEFIYY